ncbi:hypothetical protein BCU64_025715 [Vibrio lentus]
MNSIVFDDDLVNEDEADSVTLSGQVEVGSTVNSIVISDENPANDVTDSGSDGNPANDVTDQRQRWTQRQAP